MRRGIALSVCSDKVLASRGHRMTTFFNEMINDGIVRVPYEQLGSWISQMPAELRLSLIHI